MIQLEIEEEKITLTNRQLKSIVNDSAKSAEAVNLVYVSDTSAGITRVKKGDSFEYYYKEQKIKDDEELLRIKHLAIPPAWQNVWICPKANGHLQATGTDALGRKQYKYHLLWNTLRNHTKFYRLHEFGKAIPSIRLQLEKDISLPQLPVEKVLATVVSLMERTNIRIGSNFYEKLYGSFGLTTLKDKHVKINGKEIKFSFVGKKGIQHHVSIKSSKLAHIVKKCRDIPGKELFQYLDENGERKCIDSGMVNEYIKKISGGDFTAKDFRTWAGTVQALLAFKELGFHESQTEAKRKVVEALDIVSKHLGNTRAVCKKYYVHPVIISLYENKDLEKYITQLDKIEKDDDKTGLTAEEKLLMKILESNK
jgi:DNA topoisomerase I